MNKNEDTSKQLADANTLCHISSSHESAFPNDPDSSDDAGGAQLRRDGGSETQDPRQGDIKSLFPYTLFTLLEEAERDGYESIVSWRPCGEAFKVINRDEFMKQVLPRYFKQTKYKSFIRQLNLWGFSCLHEGPDRGSYVHKMFLKGKKDQCLEIRRQKSKRSSQQASNTAAYEEACAQQPYRLATLYQGYDLGANGAQSLINSIDAGMPSPLSQLFMQADAESAAAAKSEQLAAPVLSAGSYSIAQPVASAFGGKNTHFGSSVLPASYHSNRHLDYNWNQSAPKSQAFSSFPVPLMLKKKNYDNIMERQEMFSSNAPAGIIRLEDIFPSKSSSRLTSGEWSGQQTHSTSNYRDDATHSTPGFCDDPIPFMTRNQPHDFASISDRGLYTQSALGLPGRKGYCLSLLGHP